MSQPVTINVIDDDEALRDSLRMLLECEGFRVVTFESGAGFLREMPLTGSGCMLVDVHMPGMSGLDLVERLRKDGFAIPAVLMTGLPDRRIRAAVDRLGAVLMEKPFRHGALLETLSKALGQTPFI